MERIKVIKGCPLFSGMSEAQISTVLEEIRVRKKNYQKGEILLHAGEVPEEFGIVLNGCILILKEEFSGSTTLLAQGMPGEIFAEAFVAAGEPSLVTVAAAKDTEILWIHYGRMMKGQGPTGAQVLLMENMMQILAKKNLFLAGRVSHLSRRTLREKVLSYLGEQAARQGKESFEIPFDRQGLADYLAADRSALSAVLGKLKKEGLLSFRKNQFTLYGEHAEDRDKGGWA